MKIKAYLDIPFIALAFFFYGCQNQPISQASLGETEYTNNSSCYNKYNLWKEKQEKATEKQSRLSEESVFLEGERERVNVWAGMPGMEYRYFEESDRLLEKWNRWKAQHSRLGKELDQLQEEYDSFKKECPSIF